MGIVDFYEAVNEHDLELREFADSDSSSIESLVMLKLRQVNEWLHDQILPHYEHFSEHHRIVPADITRIDDANYRIRPNLRRDCRNGRMPVNSDEEVLPLNIANYTDEGVILISENLYRHRSFTERSKAGLAIHEAVYAFLRERYGDENSNRARRIVGLLFSTLENAQIAERVDNVLGIVLGMEFTTIAAGTFTMGSPEYEPGRYPNEAQRPVTLTHSFEMMTTEVTQATYFEVTGMNPSYFKNQEHCPASFESRTGHTTGQVVTLCPNNPVERVNFLDAQNFISLLNLSTGMNYRLPTEAEWEYAARAGTMTAYSFGDSASFLSAHAIYRTNSGNRTHPVGPMRSYANIPNNNGLYDMHGNVLEWTQDWYTQWPSCGVNPTGSAATGSYRALRGGSWNSVARYLRSADRRCFLSSRRRDYVGFRLVRTLP